ncbi:MAG: dihydrolipoyl dehydrogenase [Candidatus Omnitrophica bacterium CG11_big_fil_rev_8_21_14_0_20_64_10]|nr:MAG: dihydrolipoyl dehydrogenase [Candidatus Omnitrophica bacterium CG11_big_fil_rev_8_21_14_0_20_64_10]
MGLEPIQTEVVVVGAGPGGYTAAFYAADRGRKVILVEREAALGGVCLQRGCIPSKALLHATEPVREAPASAKRGVSFGPPVIELEKLRAWKGSVLQKLSGGLQFLAKKRGVEVLHGRGHFEDSGLLRVETSEGQRFIRFEKAIIAVGSKPAMPQAFDLGNKRILTSTEALELEEIPKNLLVVGGGYIGLELGTVYASLGSKVVLVEAENAILMGADPDLARPVLEYARHSFREVRLGTKVEKMATRGKQIQVVMNTGKEKLEELYDWVLVAVGRIPNSGELGLENTRVRRDPKGFVQVNDRQQTADPNILAIGDAAGGMLLAHKAAKEARVAVETILGEQSTMKEVVIPAVVFTDPEVAWCGLTETEAKEKKIPIQVARFPWSASGRALTLDRTDGVTKLILEPQTDRILGVGIVGARAGDLISEGVLAVEMGATAKDLAESVHPHPTLSETLMECAESFYGFSASALPRKSRPAAGRS